MEKKGIKLSALMLKFYLHVIEFLKHTIYCKTNFLNNGICWIVFYKENWNKKCDFFKNWIGKKKGGGK